MMSKKEGLRQSEFGPCPNCKNNYGFDMFHDDCSEQAGAKPRYCPTCKMEFKNIFEATDHELLEGERVFNPSLIMSEIMSLEIGSLLRIIHSCADDPGAVRAHCEAAYGMLYVAETYPDQFERVLIEHDKRTGKVKDE